MPGMRTYILMTVAVVCSIAWPVVAQESADSTGSTGGMDDIGQAQIEMILEEYVAFYNIQRRHQGLQQQIPNPVESEQMHGAICKGSR